MLNPSPDPARDDKNLDKGSESNTCNIVFVQSGLSTSESVILTNSNNDTVLVTV